MADTPTSLFDMVRDFCKFPKAFFQFSKIITLDRSALLLAVPSFYNRKLR